MRNLLLASCACIAAFATTARANDAIPGCVAATIPNAALVGEGRMTYMMMQIYDARLYAADGTVQGDAPMALSLTYLRRLSSTRIVDQTIEEIRKQGFADEVRLAGWHTTLQDILPNVEEGTTLTGVLDSQGATRFYNGATPIGTVTDPAFGRLFFAIWLGPDTTAPELRSELLHHTG